MLFSSSAFAVEFYDVSKQEAYAQELEKKFHEKYKDGLFTTKDYNREVMIPFYKFIEEKQKTDKSGLELLHIEKEPKKKSFLQILRGW